MDLKRPPRPSGHFTLFPSSRLTRIAGCLTLALASGAAAQKTPFGPECQPEQAPPGYPIDLVMIQGKSVRLGISDKEVRDLAEEFGLGVEEKTESWIRLLVREMGDQEVFLPAFLLGRHEVTNEQYEAYVKAMAGKVRFPFDWWKEDDLRQHREEFHKKNQDKKGARFVPQEYWLQNYQGLKWEMPPDRARQPVSYVSYRDAEGYCSWAGMRLPYEAEWQLALQGPTQKPARYIWGDKWEQDEALDVLGLKSIRDAKKRDVGTWEKSRSVFGVDDMLGNVWEWTREPFLEFDDYAKLMREVQKWRRKKRQQPIPEPLWRADKRIVRGGSYNNRGQAGIVFRSNARMPLSVFQTVDDLGFRVAKSLDPALDATTLWYNNDFNADSLWGHELDLPSTREMRRAKGQVLTFEQLGIERWQMNGEIIKKYEMVSFAPVRELKYKNEKELNEASAADGKEGKHGLPVAGLFTSVPFRVQQGVNKYQDLDPGMYVISYRGKGLPRELEVAMGLGAPVLKRNKGKRVAEAEGKEEAGAKDAKKSGKDAKEAGKDAKEQEQKGQIVWTDIVDKYGVPDEITEDYPKKKPKEIVLQPGNLKIPADKNILVLRKHDGGYVGWAEFRGLVRKARAKSTPPKLEIDSDNNKLEYTGGPRTSAAADRFLMQIQIRLPDGELNKGWITPDSKLDLAKKNSDGRKPRVNAKPTQRK